MPTDYNSSYEQVLQQISVLYFDTAHDDTRLISGMAELSAIHGSRVYRDFFSLVTGKNLGSQQSVIIWQEMLQHRAVFIAPEYHHVGLRPAMLDYLYRVVGEIENPRLIDAAFIENIMKTSVSDGLTGLYNHSFFKAHLEKMIVQGRRRQDSAFSLILLDLDHFKQYNDTCGHLCGDEAIKTTAKIIRDSIREENIACRYGGEEFAILLPDTDLGMAYNIAERIRERIEKEPFPRQEWLASRNLTISGGIAQYPLHGVDVSAIIDYADVELYKAKAVRNRIASLGSEKRQSARFPVKSLVEYATIEGSLYRPAMSIDASDCGIGIGCETMLPVGTVISLRLTRPFWHENVQIEATIRQSKRTGELVYAGLEFNEPLHGLMTPAGTAGRNFNPRSSTGETPHKNQFIPASTQTLPSSKPQPA